MQNFQVNIRLEREYFVPDVMDKHIAIHTATEHFLNNLAPVMSGLATLEEHARILAVQTSNTLPPVEITTERLKQIQTASLELSNNFTRDELKLLVEDLQFYIRNG